MTTMRLFNALLFALLLQASTIWAANLVPTDVEQPGTQPLEVSLFDLPDNCAGCHDPTGNSGRIAPSPSWSGSPMAHAGRDPLFWATLAIAEQDFDGSGDLCLRCHSTAGWIVGNSTPTDGSALESSDAFGVDCEFCHKLTDPNDSDPLLQGVQTAPYVANDNGDPGADPMNVLSYYGTGMTSFWAGTGRLGPYQTPSDADPSHGAHYSRFHRSVDFCGTCHDVSNPVVGNLAHNNGAQSTADTVYTDNPTGTGPGQLGGPVDDKAAFNNQPYKYGIIERTFSEYKAGLFPLTRVSDYNSLPTDLQAGAIEAARDAALLAEQGGDYADGTPRYFSCQTCHMSPAEGKGAKQGKAPVRTDLAVHDLTGGNYWIGPAIQYLDSFDPSKLRLGSGLTAQQIVEMNDASNRARQQLNQAASLSVDGYVLTVTNLTGHKLITGYPEGRRMWLNIRWYDSGDGLIREDGAYGPLVDDTGNPVLVIDPALGTPVQVRSLQDLHDRNSKVYEAHYGISKEWAVQLSNMGYADSMVLAYDRLTGDPSMTLGNLRTQPAGSKAETFHFVLNNVVIKDNRIPPYGMDAEEARIRNILPVPAYQYGGGTGGTYNYWDEVLLNPPVGAAYAEIELKYQPTSWEYIQFLDLANDGSNGFLEQEGKNILEAWLNTTMAEPHVMSSKNWTPPAATDCNGDGVTVDLGGRVFQGPNPISCQTTQSISVTSPGAIVQAGAQVTFISPSIVLADGFSVEKGGVFTAGNAP